MRNKVTSLKSKIITQFAIIILPLMAVLIYQTISDIKRAADLQRAFHLHDYIHTAKGKYKTFVNGVVDAVDTGAVGRNAIDALNESTNHLQELSQADSTQDFAGLTTQLGSVYKTINANPSITSVLPLRETINQIDKKLSDIDVAYEDASRQAIIQSIASAERQKLIVAAATLFTLLATAYFVWRMIRGLTQPLNEAEQLANRIASGEIRSDCKASSSQDIGNLMASLCEMNNNLYRIISRVKEAAGTVSVSSASLSSSASEVMSAAERQRSTVGQTRADIEVMNDSIRQVAERAATAQQGAAKTQKVAQDGSANMSKSLAATEQVVAAVESAAMKIGQLTESVQKINEFTQVIRGIANQTNLLALNAAIEAARAGEQGRGFAVVADEVRKLAERTALGTEDIANIVNTIHEQTSEAVESMDQVKQDVAQGADYSRVTSEILQQIVASAQEAAEQARQNAAAATEQLALASKAVDNTERIAAIPDENTGRIQQMHHSADGLAGTATELQSLIEHFKLE